MGTGRLSVFAFFMLVFTGFAAHASDLTAAKIAGLQYGRASQVQTQQPDLTRFLTTPPSGFANANVDDKQGRLAFHLAQDKRPFWADIKAHWTKNDGLAQRQVLMSFGHHRQVGERVLVGAVFQLDQRGRKSRADKTKGKGWLAGPYVVVKSRKAPIYFETRVLAGRTDNDISPDRSYTDDFYATRWLAQVKVTGERQVASTTFRPSFDLSSTSDRTDSYMDTMGTKIDSQRVDVSKLSAGLDLSRPVPVKRADLEVFGGLRASYSKSANTADAGGMPQFEGGRGRIEFGLDYDADRRGAVTFETSYDGIGSEYESYGISVRYSLNF